MQATPFLLLQLSSSWFAFWLQLFQVPSNASSSRLVPCTEPTGLCSMCLENAARTRSNERKWRRLLCQTISHTNTHTHALMHGHTHTHTWMDTHTHTDTHADTHTDTHTHTHTGLLWGHLLLLLPLHLPLLLCWPAVFCLLPRPCSRLHYHCQQTQRENLAPGQLIGVSNGDQTQVWQFSRRAEADFCLSRRPITLHCT